MCSWDLFVSVSSVEQTNAQVGGSLHWKEQLQSDFTWRLWVSHSRKEMTTVEAPRGPITWRAGNSPCSPLEPYDPQCYYSNNKKICLALLLTKKQAKKLKCKSVKAVCITDLSETFVAVMVANTAALKEARPIGGAQGVAGTVDGWGLGSGVNKGQRVSAFNVASWINQRFKLTHVSGLVAQIFLALAKTISLPHHHPLPECIAAGAGYVWGQNPAESKKNCSTWLLCH